MADPFVGEIRLFAGNFAPRNYALCDGQLLAIQQNDVLFALLGTTYGGDGRVTFALPDLRGRIPVHQGHGPGLTTRLWGQRYGSETVTLTPAQVPSHTHGCFGASAAAASQAPGGHAPGVPASPIYAPQGPDANMDSSALSEAGGPHENVMPCLVLNFIIALYGVWPPRS